MNARKLLDNYCEEHILNREETLELFSLTNDDIPDLFDRKINVICKVKGEKKDFKVAQAGTVLVADKS